MKVMLFIILLILLILLIFFFILMKSNKKNIIDLSKLNPIKSKDTKDYEIKSKIEKKKFYPMFLNPEDAKKASKTNTIHIAVPRLMPASPDVWKNYKNKNQIFYMPNDKKPHFHGDAPHHAAKFSIDKVWLMSKNKYNKVKNKQIEEYRSKRGIKNFNNGKSNTPVETWIHWRIPYDKKEYPMLIVKKHTILWWDFKSMHNLMLISNKKDYDNNNFKKNNSIKISRDKPEKETLITIMDKVGKFYFACTISGHANLGHKIIIKVV